MTTAFSARYTSRSALSVKRGVTEQSFMAKILVIDDEAAILETLGIILRKRSSGLYRCRNRRFVAVLQCLPDIVIFRYPLIPDLYGIDVLKQIQLN